MEGDDKAEGDGDDEVEGAFLTPGVKKSCESLAAIAKQEKNFLRNDAAAGEGTA